MLYFINPSLSRRLPFALGCRPRPPGAALFDQQEAALWLAQPPRCALLINVRLRVNQQEAALGLPAAPPGAVLINQQETAGSNQICTTNLPTHMMWL